MKFFIVLGTFLAMSQALFSALPPLYQSANEIKAILSSKSMGTVLNSGELITDIQRNKNGYEITTNKNRVQVDVINKPSKGAGPIQFEIKFGKVQPL